MESRNPMKRLPLFVSLIAVVALSASLAYWTMQWLTPPVRPLAASLPVNSAPAPSLEAAAGLFGGQSTVVVASNYQLKGVVAAGNGRGSAAILAADGKPAQALGVGEEVAPGVTVKQIAPRFVLLSEGGATKRVELPAEVPKAGAGAGTRAASAAPQPMPPAFVPGSSLVPATAVPPPHQ
jgi:general secretion pathway protein C